MVKVDVVSVISSLVITGAEPRAALALRADARRVLTPARAEIYNGSPESVSVFELEPLTLFLTPGITSPGALTRALVELLFVEALRAETVGVLRDVVARERDTTAVLVAVLCVFAVLETVPRVVCCAFLGEDATAREPDPAREFVLLLPADVTRDTLRPATAL